MYRKNVRIILSSPAFRHIICRCVDAFSRDGSKIRAEEVKKLDTDSSKKIQERID